MHIIIRAALYGNLHSAPAISACPSTSISTTRTSNGGLSTHSIETELTLYLDQCMNGIDVHYEALDFWRINHSKFPRYEIKLLFNYWILLSLDLLYSLVNTYRLPLLPWALKECSHLQVRFFIATYWNDYLQFLSAGLIYRNHLKNRLSADHAEEILLLRLNFFGNLRFVCFYFKSSDFIRDFVS